MNKPTFNQIIAAIGAGVFSLGLMLVLFIPMHGNPQFQPAIIVAFSSSMTACLGYLIGSTSGSQAKDEAAKNTTDNLVSALKDSQPTQTKNA